MPRLSDPGGMMLETGRELSQAGRLLRLADSVPRDAVSHPGRDVELLVSDSFWRSDPDGGAACLPAVGPKRCRSPFPSLP